MNELDAVLRAVAGARVLGKPAALATVVSVVGSSYRRPGARLLVVRGGTTTGGVSGGCLEGDVALRAAAAIEDGEVTLAAYDTTGDEDIDLGVGLGCRGVIQVLIEPLPPAREAPWLDLLGRVRQAHQHAVLATVWRASDGAGASAGNRLLQDDCGMRWTDIEDAGLAQAVAADAAEVLEAGRSMAALYPLPTGEVDVLLEYLPRPVPLVVFGGGADAVPLVRLAKGLGWHVTVVDAGVEARRSRFREADVVIGCGPGEVRARVPLAPHSVGVVMTHNYRRDLGLLEALLPSPVGYLGLLGPKARAERLLRDLARAGIVASPEQLGRLHAPAGLDLGAEGPEEIALAIVAEVMADLAGRTPRPLRERPGPIHEQLGLEVPT